MDKFSVRDEIIETINKLFVFTDTRRWEELQFEVFANLVMFDTTSVGGVKEELSAKAICEMWAKDFAGLDHVHHHAGNYLVHLHDATAHVTCYATATHYKASALKGKTRDFVGSYDIRLMKGASGWRIYEFSYMLKFITGNTDLV